MCAVAATGLPSVGGAATSELRASPLAAAVAHHAAAHGEQALLAGVVVVPGRAPQLRPGRAGDPASFPVSWVNPLGDVQAVEAIESWIAPQRLPVTRVILGRRNGTGRLAWRVEARRRGHAEVWLLAPNGTLLSHRRR
jgi:hypothetical protein